MNFNDWRNCMCFHCRTRKVYYDYERWFGGFGAASTRIRATFCSSFLFLPQIHPVEEIDLFTDLRNLSCSKLKIDDPQFHYQSGLKKRNARNHLLRLANRNFCCTVQYNDDRDIIIRNFSFSFDQLLFERNCCIN